MPSSGGTFNWHAEGCNTLTMGILGSVSQNKQPEESLSLRVYIDYLIVYSKKPSIPVVSVINNISPPTIFYILQGFISPEDAFIVRNKCRVYS